MKRYSLLPLLLLAVPLGMAACESDNPGTGTNGGGMGLELCTGPEVVSVEQEPNDGTTEAEINVIQSEDGDVTITGTSATCGNDGVQWTGDIDVFRVNFGCQGTADFTLTWVGADDTSADLDYNVLAVDWSVTHYASVGYQWGLESAPEAAEVETGIAGVGGPMLVRIMCWQGDGDQAWTFTIDWEPHRGAAGDDDDSATGDDDDSAGG